MMEMQFDDTARMLTLRLGGRMESSACPAVAGALEARLAELLPMEAREPAAPLQVTFDLAEVDFVSSPFLRICLQTVRRVGEGRLAIVNTAPTIKRVFKISGMDGVLRVT